MNMNRKGMSQTLALIVAASVLMMTALTVIFLAQGSLGDFGSNSRSQSCASSIESQCSTWRTTNDPATASSPHINAPQTCIAEDGGWVGGSAPSGSAFTAVSSTDPSQGVNCQ